MPKAKRKGATPNPTTEGSTSNSLSDIICQQIRANPNFSDEILGCLDLIPPNTASEAGPSGEGDKPTRSKKRRVQQAPERLDGTTVSETSAFSIASDEGESSSDSGDTDGDSRADLGIFNTVSGPEVTQKMKAKIWSQEYTDLSKLYFGNDETDVEISVRKTSQETIKSIKRQPQRVINNIMTWSRAFQIYASVYTLKYPSEASQMFQYMSLVQSLANKFTNWYQYDMKFCTLRSRQSLPWGSLHTDTYLYISLMTPANPFRSQLSSNTIKRTNRPSSAPDHPRSPNPQVFREGFCWTYQKQGRCVKPNCPHTHKCSVCNGKHAGTACNRLGHTQTESPKATTSTATK